MSGELQTIPARHGVATFVPRGRTIKIINTYGKQVVSTWAFGLHAPPEEGDDEEEVEEEDVEDMEQKAEELKEGLDNEDGKEVEKEIEEEIEKPKKETQKTTGSDRAEKVTSNDGESSQVSYDDPPEQAPEAEASTSGKKPEKRTWSSYLPSIPYRSKTQANNASSSKTETKAEKEQNEATSQKWSSYLPTGKGFSSYVPNVQLPDSQGVMSAFKASHYRDPNKSYAEQLYDFSKTPVGAGGIAAATGSGTASSIYAAYSAYTKANPSKNNQPPMEYLSLPHTRASAKRLVPVVNDTLLTNLRSPLMTLVEDTTPGAHDTLTAACDANLYAALGVDKPEEHGSCAENLVLALKELNEKAGLQGTKAIGADITVNIAPTPLHLFMNTPLEVDSNAQSEGSGAKGATLKVEEPKGKKRGYVRFKAERDMVIVLSACPMDVGPQNGGRCMAANFMVEEAEEDTSKSTASLKKTKAAPKKLDRNNPGAKNGMPKPRGGPQKIAAVKASAQRRDSAADDPPESELPTDKKSTETPKKDEGKQEDAPKAKKKPKKLERRSTNTPTSSKTSP